MIVYKIQNKINDKIYIGQTTKSFEKRFADHLKTKSHIGNALRKYGANNFDLSIVEDGIDNFKILCEREIFWIAQYDCRGYKGYNHTGGGDGVVNPSEEVRKKQSIVTKKLWENTEYRQNQSEKHQGKICSEETLQKMRKPHGPFTEEHKQNLRGPKSEEWIEKHTGPRGPLSPEAYKNVSKANKDLEKREKISKKLMHHPVEEKTKEKIRIKATGENSSQYGSYWITNGIIEIKKRKNDYNIPEGFYKGRHYQRKEI